MGGVCGKRHGKKRALPEGKKGEDLRGGTTSKRKEKNTGVGRKEVSLGLINGARSGEHCDVGKTGKGCGRGVTYHPQCKKKTSQAKRRRKGLNACPLRKKEGVET